MARQIEINYGTVVSDCGITLSTAKNLQLETDDLNIRDGERIKHNVPENKLKLLRRCHQLA
jgi:hypothetical protein